jgi:hypothetical protein
MQITLKHLRKLINETLDAANPEFRTIVLDDDVHLVHRSERPIRLEDCDAETPRMSRQSRRGRLCVSGLYTYLQSETYPGIERYGDHILNLVIPAGSKILDASSVGGSTSRLSSDNMEVLRSQGYVAIKGRDLVGPPEWIIISNEILR